MVDLGTYHGQISCVTNLETSVSNGVVKCLYLLFTYFSLSTFGASANLVCPNLYSRDRNRNLTTTVQGTIELFIFLLLFALFARETKPRDEFGLRSLLLFFELQTSVLNKTLESCVLAENIHGPWIRYGQ